MTWFKVDDSFYDHPKVFDAPDCAVSLWTRAGSWASRNLTDGFVPAPMPARLCEDADRAVRELLNRGLWKRARGGYQFHDWEDRNPLRAEVEKDRARKVEAGRLGGLASGKKRSTGQAGAKAGASRVLQEVPNPRPDPTRSSGGALTATPTTARAQPSSPPEFRCPEHLENPTDGPCGPCGDARRARTRWDMADAERRRNTPKCRDHRGQPADNCALCRSEALAAEEAP